MTKASSIGYNHIDCMNVDGIHALLCESETDNKKPIDSLPTFLGHHNGAGEGQIGDKI